ncbi:hypothetical protein NPS29_12625 [Pseudomonas putida]|uniref:hypothetical protein n=1 Tax=Pseudomonas putida TaxID=303 RepID=UPI0023643704|nr:hypothetical protein [Pseudomonas putida]MDD1966166.1 hypothetical protein [Pseudomonas putida]
MTFLISHQTQPTNNTCFSTCMAMLKCIPAAVVVGQIHDWYYAGDVSVRQVLERLEIPFESFDTADLPKFGHDGVYLVAVPSVNQPGWMHQVLCECFAGQFIVHDPCRGLRGAMHYVAALTEGAFNEVKFHGYVIDAFIPRSYLLETYAFKASAGVAA